MKKGLLLIACCCVFIYTLSQVPQSKKIDSLLSSWDHDNTPGGALGIIKNGKLIYTKGYGMADLEHEVPITANTLFFIGSTAKQFTAFCILLLEEQGKLKLDDEIQKFLPDFPRYGSSITIRHLIHHTSGIRDLFVLLSLQGKTYLDHLSEKDAYELIKRQTELNFSPGERYSYTNSGYFLLGKIIKAASGKSLKEFAKENIFDQLGMKNTLYLDDNRDLVKNRAFSYGKSSGKHEFNNMIRRYDLVGSAGIYSTIEDLYLWDQNFYHNKLGKGEQEIVRRMQEESRLNNGEANRYAFGLVNGTYKGLKNLNHSGGHAGYGAQIIRFPDQELSVIMLTNRSDGNVVEKSNKVADMFLSHKPDEHKPRKFTKLTAKELEKFSGVYVENDDVTIREVYVKNDTLRYVEPDGRSFNLQPVSNDEFILFNNTNEILVKIDEVYNMFLSVNGRVYSTRKRYIPKTYTKEELARFEGTYYCSDIDATYKLKMQGDNLALFANDDEEGLKFSVLTDNILSNPSFGGIFHFETGKRKKITGFRFFASRAQRLLFRKQ